MATAKLEPELQMLLPRRPVVDLSAEDAMLAIISCQPDDAYTVQRMDEMGASDEVV